MLLELGAAPQVAQAQMRHSDPRITLEVYSHVVGESQRKAVDRVAELFVDLVGPKAMIRKNGFSDLAMWMFGFDSHTLPPSSFVSNRLESFVTPPAIYPQHEPAIANPHRSCDDVQ